MISSGNHELCLIVCMYNPHPMLHPAAQEGPPLPKAEPGRLSPVPETARSQLGSPGRSPSTSPSRKSPVPSPQPAKNTGLPIDATKETDENDDKTVKAPTSEETKAESASKPNEKPPVPARKPPVAEKPLVFPKPVLLPKPDAPREFGMLDQQGG